MITKRLRTWQREALQGYRTTRLLGTKELLWEATPGAGKTVAALIVAADQLRQASVDKATRRTTLFIVVPTAHLKIQWAKSATRLSLRLDPAFRRTTLGLAPDYHGAVVTYQQIANNPKAFRQLMKGSPVILDEVHHAGDGLTWGAALREALTEARFILSLSGTAFRSDSNPIPFVKYDDIGRSVPDYSYTYSRAIEEGVCRPVAFFGYGGEIAWGTNQQVVQVNFADELDRANSARRLRAALEPSSGWIGPMLKDAHQMLLQVRNTHPDAGGLLVAADQDHARELAFQLRSLCGVSPTIVLSDDATSSKRIKAFTNSDTPWLVACNMVSEGVDIPRLRVGVYATTIRTRMYFRQFLGRIVRRTEKPQGAQIAYCYLPADPAIQWLAKDVEKEQRHLLKKQGEDIFAEQERDRERSEPGEQNWQAMQAVNSGVTSIIVNGNQLALFGDPQNNSSESSEPFGLPPPTKLAEYQNLVEQQVHARFDENQTHSELKENLARNIKELVALYHRQTGKPYSAIHTLLNKEQRVRSQLECTYSQLEERLRLLKQMLKKITV